MEEYLEKILTYLPIQFADEEANEFVKYLSEAYIENLEKEKYQFAFKAFHMLYMTFIYKISWSKAIVSEAKQLFDYPDFIPKESDAITTLLKKTGFRKNDIQKCQNHVIVRNHCSHASGKIEYDDNGIKHFINEEIKYIERLQKKIEPELKKFLQNFLEENWQQNFITGDFYYLFLEHYFSVKDLELLNTIDLPLFRKKSNNEKNIMQKIYYLLLIYEIQNQIESEENLFLEKLSIFMIDLPEKVIIVKDEDNANVFTSEIIEEFLIPIISNFSDEDRKKAEKILKLGE